VGSSERFVSANEVASHLGLSQSFIRKRTTDRHSPIPHHRVPGGRSVLYRLTEVEAWITGEHPCP
jgi:excisionase family DNA binding protein